MLENIYIGGILSELPAFIVIVTVPKMQFIFRFLTSNGSDIQHSDSNKKLHNLC